MKRYISLIILAVTLIFCILPLSAKNQDFTVVIDAGHGGHDEGATDNGAREKDINLAVALQLGRMIEKNLKGVNVLYTRKDDVFKTLQERADLANKAGADLFISIHVNSVAKSNQNRTSIEGAQVYALGLHKDGSNMDVARRENSVIQLEGNKQAYQGFDPNKDESYIIFEMAQKKNLSKSIKFAKEVQKNLVSTAQRKNRGVHQAGFWVLWATSMPSVLIELDFICNPSSVRYMTSDEGEQKLALSIFDAVKSYYKQETNNSVTIREADKGSSQKKSSGKKGKSKKKKSRKSTRSENDSAENATPTQELESNEDCALLPEAVEEENRKHLASTPDRNSRSANTPRRRRNSSAKELSDRSINQVSDIPLNSEQRWMATITEIPAEQEPSVTVSEEISEPKQQSKKKTNRKKSRVQRFETVYAIQLLSSDEQLSQSAPCFHGLQPLSMFRENNVYKYIYGQASNRKEIEKLLSKIKKDFPEAIIIESRRNVKNK